MFRIKLPQRWVNCLALVMMAAALNACGGGGGANGGCTTIDPTRDAALPGCPGRPSNPTAPSTSATLALALTTATGASTALVTPTQPGTLVATLKDGNGNALANTEIDFVSNDGSAAPTPASALSDASGKASVTLKPGSQSGAYTVTASATVAGKLISGSTSYAATSVLPTSPAIFLTLTSASGAATTALTAQTTGTLVALVIDVGGKAVPNSVVNFATTDASAVFTPASASALSDANGKATIAIAPGTQTGAYTATARTTVGGAALSASTTYAATSPVPTQPTLVLGLSNSAGPTTAVTPSQPGTLTAVLIDASGKPIANTVVSFVTSDKSGAFLPASGSALSDASGKVSIGLAAGTASGGYTVTASASVASQTLTASLGYAVNLPTITLSTPVVSPSSLAAGGTASLTVTAQSGAGIYTPALSVSFSSPCVTAGKASISSPVTTVNGVASTSYTDMGCGGADAITASATVNGATITSSATLTVLPASAGQLVFVSALPQNIALKGTGGAGRQESSTVTFKALDRNGNPVSGQSVSFALNTTAGGLSLNPATSTTGAGGLVSTTVQAGTVNTPVRVTATLTGGNINTLSDQLVVSTGVPDQNSFSLSAAILNVEGGDFNGCTATSNSINQNGPGTLITARLGDHFHNPVPDGTAVSFTASGGTVDASCLTGLSNTTLTDGTVVTQKGTPGECTVRYCSGNPRPANGRVTVLAYALGEESFFDTNGNNQFDPGEPYTDLGEPFRNDRAITNANANFLDDGWSTGNAVRAPGEQYIDSNGDGSWTQFGDHNYNGVLNGAASVNSKPANTIHVRQALVMVLSKSTPAVTWLDGATAAASGPLALAHCVNNTTFVNDTRTFRFAIRDSNPTVFANNTGAKLGLPFDLPGNLLPAGTTIAFTATNGVILGDGITLVAPNSDAPDASGWIYTVQMISDATQNAGGCLDRAGSGALTIRVTTPSGQITTRNFSVTD
ncbi:Ig-like domain-containing protein [Rugamonas sp.]|uniref:beta strand repeat-containing protein n=1 Tax=Rugamonas sp. TaxID=1926287 RepID=UPI00260065A5|nr:Ig-like domain-containing protein [Rugamonas sp.]